MTQPPLLRTLLLRVIFGVAAGSIYAGVRYGFVVSGALVGGLMAPCFFLLERYVLRRNLGGVFRPLPFLAYFALRSALYVAVIVIPIAVVSLVFSGGFRGIALVDFVFALVLVIGAILLFSVNDLLGQGVLFAFAAGRYYHPRI